MEIHHAVYFVLRYAEGSEEERIFFSRADALGSIPGVQSFRRVREVSSNNPFHFGLMMQFESEAAYEAYNEHPDHMRFVEEVWIPGVSDFQEIDFVEITGSNGGVAP